MVDRPPSLRKMRRVLSDPLRLRILELLWVRPHSAGELAEWLGTRADRLYYHLRQLEQAGLVEVGEYRQLTGGKVERVYARVAVEPPGDDAAPAETAHFLGQVLLTARADVNDAFAAKERGREREVRVMRTGVRLTRAQLDELAERLYKLAENAGEDAHGVSDEAVWVSVSLALVDMQDRPRETQPEERA